MTTPQSRDLLGCPARRREQLPTNVLKKKILGPGLYEAIHENDKINVMIRGLYEVEEIANLSGLKPSSVRAYCAFGATTLVRGRDYTVLSRYRFGHLNRKLVITKRGLDRIISRDFVRLYPITRKPSPQTREIITRLVGEASAVNPCNPGTYEASVRQRQLRALRLAYYLVTNPCRQKSCVCPCHSPVGGNYQVNPANGNGNGTANHHATTPENSL